MAEDDLPEAVAPVELPRGRYAGRLDDKGRLKLPATFQHFFSNLPEKKLYLTSLDRSIAQLYPIAAWRENEEFFSSFRANPAAARNIAFNASDLGADVEMDAQGRITVHPDLRLPPRGQATPGFEKIVAALTQCQRACPNH